MSLARMTKTSQQVISQPGTVKINLDTVSFSEDCTCSSGKIKPNVAGYYLVVGQVTVNCVPSSGFITSLIYKNGSQVSKGTTSYFSQEVPTDPIVSSIVSDLIYCNGTTDYLELFVTTTVGSLDLNPSRNYLSVQLVSYSGGESFVWDQEEAQTEWNVIHNLGTRAVEFQVYDREWNVITPERIQSVDGSSGYIVFSIPTSGYAVVISGSGQSGYSGYTGYSGYSGISGYSGSIGISGYSGIFGYSGYSGISGISGYSGMSGLADESIFTNEVDCGSGGDVTINWSSGYRQFFTLERKSCIKFEQPNEIPSWAVELTLRIYDTETGGKVVFWPSNIRWEKSGEHSGPLTFFPGVGDFYIFKFYWNGKTSEYLGWYHGPFRSYVSGNCCG